MLVSIVLPIYVSSERIYTVDSVRFRLIYLYLVTPGVSRQYPPPLTPTGSANGVGGRRPRGHRVGLLPSATATRTLHSTASRTLRRMLASLTVHAPTLCVADSVTLVWPEASSSVLEYGVWHGLLPAEPDQLKRYHTPGAQNTGENLLEVGGLEPGTECTLRHNSKTHD